MSNFILTHDWVFFLGWGGGGEIEKAKPGKYYLSMISEHQIKNNSHFDTWLSWNVLKNNSYFVHVYSFVYIY